MYIVHSLTIKKLLTQSIEFIYGRNFYNNVDGKMFKIIHNIYANAKSCVRLGNSKSTSFSSNIGVRQGRKPFSCPFSIFLNDLSEFITDIFNGRNDITEMSSFE